MLTNFLNDLYTTGQVTVAARIDPFPDKDLLESLLVLQQRYDEDVQEMPYTAPDFAPDAALWSARYLYRAAQLMLLRELGPEAVSRHLVHFVEKKSPTVIYSVDLVLRHLPALFNLARGLSPEDVLVKELKRVAVAWPFSSVGMVLEGEPELAPILEDVSLRTAYVDRIIAARDKDRAQVPQVLAWVEAALGAHADLFWPGF